MIRITTADLRVSSLEERLLPRRFAESSGNTHRNGASRVLYYCHSVIIPVLRFGLKAAGLYPRGKRNALDLHVRHHRLRFPDLPASLDGFRLLHLSDLHIDGVEGLTEALCGLLPDLPADLCVLTGDYRFHTHGPSDEVHARMRAVVSAIRSRLGIAAILGNHDTAGIAVELERMGVRMLINESVEVTDRLWLTGADDIEGSAPFADALRQVPPAVFHVALVHTPQFSAEAESSGAALYLCGHTHAGQICLPGGVPLITNATCPKKYTSGLWKHGGMVGFTSAGAGCCMLPVRYNCPPEITVFHLSR